MLKSVEKLLSIGTVECVVSDESVLAPSAVEPLRFQVLGGDVTCNVGGNDKVCHCQMLRLCLSPVLLLDELRRFDGALPIETKRWALEG